jgi:hypothetical protein
MNDAFATHSDSGEQYTGNLGVIDCLTKIWNHLKGTLLYLYLFESCYVTFIGKLTIACSDSSA